MRSDQDALVLKKLLHAPEKQANHFICQGFRVEARTSGSSHVYGCMLTEVTEVAKAAFTQHIPHNTTRGRQYSNENVLLKMA